MYRQCDSFDIGSDSPNLVDQGGDLRGHPHIDVPTSVSIEAIPGHRKLYLCSKLGSAFKEPSLQQVLARDLTPISTYIFVSSSVKQPRY